MLVIEYTCETCDIKHNNDINYERPYFIHLSDVLRHIIDNPSHCVRQILLEEAEE